MKKSKIKRIESAKPFNGNHGTIIYHNLEMENGDKINIGKKTEQKVGWELTYEIIDEGQEYNKAKAVKEEGASYSGGPKKNDDYQKGIEVGHAINNAVNLMCAGVELNVVAEKKCATAEEKIYENAKIIMLIAARLKSE
jgi:hypothetical protein